LLLLLLSLMSLAGLLWPLPARAQPAASPTEPQMRVLEDASSALAVSQVLGAPGWQALPTGAPNLGYSDAVWWFDLRWVPPPGGGRWSHLELAYPVLDQVEIWLFDRDGAERGHWRLGDKQPFGQRPVPHRHFIVPLPRTAPGQEAVRALVRVHTSSAVQLPARLWTEQAFLAGEQLDQLVQGLYLGVMLGMLAYNFFLWRVMRERVYLWYVLWVAAIASFQASIGGLAFQHLWPAATQWNDRAIVVFLALAVTSASFFMIDFLALVRRGGWMLRWPQATAWLCLLALLSAFVLPYPMAIRLAIGCAVMAMCSALAVSALRGREGFAPARIFLLAWFLVLAGGLVLAASKFGLLPRNALTEHATQVGTALEVILLSLSLAGRLQHERRLRERAQAEAMATQRRANERLEQRVAERTHDLEQLNRRLEQASRTDVLTGVANRRHFDECHASAVQRAIARGQPLGVLLLDLDHFKRINDTLGHPAGDDCLRGVAQRVAMLLSGPEGGDVLLARYGGEEFIALLPDLHAQQAQALAERIRLVIAEQPVDSVAGPVAVTASLGLCCRVPQDAADGSAMLREADEALYQAKRSGRNRVAIDLRTAAAGAP
jgi:diguanylate cyclase